MGHYKVDPDSLRLLEPHRHEASHREYILENIQRKSVKEIPRDLGMTMTKLRLFLRREGEKGIDRLKEAETPPGNVSALLAAVMIIILGSAIYANSLRGEFIRDDVYLVKRNVYIQKWSNIKKIFTENIATGGQKEWNAYRPVQMITYMMDYSLWGMNVKGYHVVNIVLHILVALSVYWFATILYGDSLLSLLTALFFIAHPVHCGAVAFISGRADLLAGLFILLSIIF